MSTFDIEVISDPVGMLPNEGFRFDDPWVEQSPNYDARVVKPAVLFADKVYLVSSRATIDSYINMHGWRISRMPMRQMEAFLALSISRDVSNLEFLGLTPADLCETRRGKYRPLGDDASADER